MFYHARPILASLENHKRLYYRYLPGRALRVTPNIILALRQNLWVNTLGMDASRCSTASLWSVATERRAKRFATAWHAVPPLPPGAALAGSVMFSHSPSLLAKGEREKTCWGSAV